MQEILVEIKIIKEYYACSNYLKAYENLFQLCRDNPHCEEYSGAAMNILSQFNDLENSVTSISLEMSEQTIRKHQLFVAFEKLTSQIKRRFDSQKQILTYEEQSIRMKEHRNMLRKSLMEVENDISDCDNPEKTELLQTIKIQLEKVIEYFRNLIKNFYAVKNYE